LVCIDPDLEEPPAGRWSCPHCESEGIEATAEEHNEEEADKAKKGENMEYCRVCLDGGGLLLCCDSCPSSYHFYCIVPAVKEVPEGEWNCSRCTVAAPPYQPQKILSWRWVETPKDPEIEEAIVRQANEPPKPPPEPPKEGEPPAPTEQEQKPWIPPPGKHPPRRHRELFVKWKYLSYWHCEWVNELQV
jgi:hypothetical protein